MTCNPCLLYFALSRCEKSLSYFSTWAFWETVLLLGKWYFGNKHRCLCCVIYMKDLIFHKNHIVIALKSGGSVLIVDRMITHLCLNMCHLPLQIFWINVFARWNSFWHLPWKLSICLIPIYIFHLGKCWFQDTVSNCYWWCQVLYSPSKLSPLF